jgi:hypothetical protein
MKPPSTKTRLERGIARHEQIERSNVHHTSVTTAASAAYLTRTADWSAVTCPSCLRAKP